jgi:Tfp pilus assembly protein PilF
MWSGDLESALETITTASNVDHRNPTVWAQMGFIYRKMGRNDDAKEALIRTVAYEEEPDDPVVVYVRLAHLLANDGNWVEARQNYLMACEKCPTATSWLGVGICSFRMGQLREAEDALAEANLLGKDLKMYFS